MCFIDHDRIKRIPVIFLQNIFFAQCLDRCKNIIRIIILMFPGNHSHRNTFVKYFLIRFQRLLCDLSSVNKKQHSFISKFSHGKSGCICFSRSCSGDQQCPLFTSFHDFLKICNKTNLHGIGL